MVERAALEMRFTGNRNVGSNPTLSASTLLPQAGGDGGQASCEKPLGSESEASQMPETSAGQSHPLRHYFPPITTG